MLRDEGLARTRADDGQGSGLVVLLKDESGARGRRVWRWPLVLLHQGDRRAAHSSSGNADEQRNGEMVLRIGHSGSSSAGARRGGGAI